MKSIERRIEINSTPEQLFQAITSEDGLKHWWTNDVKFKPSEGSDFELGFYNRSIVLKFRIDTLQQHSLVRWVCLAGPDEYKSSKITFNINVTENGVDLLLNHSELNGSDQFINHAIDSWDSVLNSLKSYVETGRDNPISRS